MGTVSKLYGDFLDIFTKVTTISIHLIKDEKGTIEIPVKAHNEPKIEIAKQNPTFKSNFK